MHTCLPPAAVVLVALLVVGGVGSGLGAAAATGSSMHSPAAREISGGAFEVGPALSPGVTPAIVGGLTAVPVLFAPDSIAFDPADGELYVADAGSGYVSIVDGTTDQDLGAVPVGSDPVDVVFDPANGDLYVANLASENVSVIDGATNRVVSTVNLSVAPGYLGVDPVSGDVYVPTANGALFVIAGSNNSVVATFPGGVGYPSDLGLAPAPVYDRANGNVYAIGVSGLNATCGCAKGFVLVLNGTHLTTVATVSTGLNPTALAVAGADSAVYVASAYSGVLSIISPSSSSVTGTIGGFHGPGWLEYDPRTTDLYVGNGGENVGVVATATGSLIASVPATPGPMVIDPSLGILDMVSGGSLLQPSTTTVISLATNTIVADVANGYVSFASPAIGLDPVTGNVYVANPGSFNLTVVGPYPIEFTAHGLRPGAFWSVRLIGAFGANRTLNSTGQPIEFVVSNGTYTYSASVPYLYASGSANGVIVVDGTGISHAIEYTYSAWVWAWLIAGTVFVPIGGWFALRWRGSGLSPLRREYAAMFQADMRRPREPSGPSSAFGKRR